MAQDECLCTIQQKTKCIAVTKVFAGQSCFNNSRWQLRVVQGGFAESIPLKQELRMASNFVTIWLIGRLDSLVVFRGLIFPLSPTTMAGCCDLSRAQSAAVPRVNRIRPAEEGRSGGGLRICNRESSRTESYMSVDWLSRYHVPLEQDRYSGLTVSSTTKLAPSGAPTDKFFAANGSLDDSIGKQARRHLGQHRSENMLARWH